MLITIYFQIKKKVCYIDNVAKIKNGVFMPDNDKGELIKNSEENKKKKITKQIVKPRKKVVIRKKDHTHASSDKPLENEEKKKVVTENNEVKAEKKEYKPGTYKPSYNNTDNNNRFNKNTGTDNRDNKKTFVKRSFQKKDEPNNAGGRPVFRKKQTPAQPVTPAPAEAKDRERSRKKILNKEKDTKRKYSEKKYDFEKSYQLKKKTVNLTNSIPESIDIIDVISISDLAKKLNLKASKVISKLMELGTMVTINDKIDADTASIVAEEFNCKVNVVSLFDETVIEEQSVAEEKKQKRPPIVTVMGHVDHGKTKLLDAIRSENVVSGESGGITQHIGAYSVSVDDENKITFIDTPGHEAFTMMRSRGAQVTDIVVLVVAADDGVKPQTVEAINHAKQADVPIIVAINKIDKPDINIDKVKQQLSDYELLPEEWGGSTLYCEISALKKIGIPELLETIILQSEVLDLKASEDVRATGFILEAKIEKGKGAVATVIILTGTLKVGDFFVAGIYYGKVRTMFSDRGEKINVATPAVPIELTGLESVPKAGDPFNVVKSEREAKMISSKRKELNKMEEAQSVKKISIKDFLNQKKVGEVQEIKVIIKADVQGSAEAIKDSLEKLSNQEIILKTVHSGVGAINENDIMLAVASKAIVLGFHVRPNPKALQIADREKVEIKRYNIIYDVIEDIKAEMEGMIKPDLQEELIGTVEVRQIFKVSKIGTIAGCYVADGKVTRNSLIRLFRDDVLIYTGKIASLKRYQDDASEVLDGTECGISLENYKDIKVGDYMESYTIKEITRNLADVERDQKQMEEEIERQELKAKAEKEAAELEAAENKEND